MCIVALALFVGEYYFNALSPIKTKLIDITKPVYQVAYLPQQMLNWFQEKSQSEKSLQLENAQLSSENLVLQAKLQKMTSLMVENVRLRELLNAKALLQERVMVAQVVSLSTDNHVHEVVINRGWRDGVYTGQAVLDAYGLLGQVLVAGESLSKVVLISDQRHAVPVQVDRNGLRFIIEGQNNTDNMQLPYVALTADLAVGDTLSSSGLGGVFPAGYPVARVASIEPDEGKAFTKVTVEPFAKLNRSRYVLLVFPQSIQNTSAQ